MSSNILPVLNGYTITAHGTEFKIKLGAVLPTPSKKGRKNVQKQFYNQILILFTKNVKLFFTRLTRVSCTTLSCVYLCNNV